VILTGADVPGLAGSAPEGIVAFRFAGGWQPVPVQVDERAVVDFGAVYDTTARGFTFLTYTDPGTFTGPDPDATFDADDELVLRGEDAGDDSAAAGEPACVEAGSGERLAIRNPVTGALGYLYLFRAGGSPCAAPPTSDVHYAFALLSGDYKATYDLRSGPNPEDSQVTAAAYRVHFSDRWIRDATEVTAGGATGVDVLDRQKEQFAPGNCSRTENTFSAGEGAFIVNRSGPVRALRGYLGCNSGPTSYRVHAFYEAREDILTALRVHPIPGIMDYFDYSPAASGMTYYNDLNVAGATVDGVPDAILAGPLAWEMVTGAQGTLVMTYTVETDIPAFAYTSYYSDDSTPSTTQCTGDAFQYGASGFQVDQSIPNTDPAVGAANVFQSTRAIAYEAPGQTVAHAAARAQELTHPLAASASPYAPTVAVTSGPARSGLRLGVSPNPVAGVLWVRWSAPAAGRASLRVYDTGGRAVASLFQGTLAAGQGGTSWDASALPSGVYFVRAELAGSRPAVARFVRLR
jgi:hypothetical protein